VFAEQGLDVSVAQIACRASVGTATLFRNFPTKDDLVYAVIEARVTELLEIGRRALEVEDPTASFEQFLSDVADIQVRDHGFFEAIQTRLIDEPELLQCKLGMTAIAETILKRAQQAGAVRKDVVADDLPLHPVCFLARWPSRQAMQHARDRTRGITDRRRLLVPR
jgi:AcrR family transcriptional regulator